MLRPRPPAGEARPLFADDAVWTSRDFGHHAGRPPSRRSSAGVSARIVFAARLAMNLIIDVDGDNGAGQWRILIDRRDRLQPTAPNPPIAETNSRRGGGSGVLIVALSA